MTLTLNSLLCFCFYLGSLCGERNTLLRPLPFRPISFSLFSITSVLEFDCDSSHPHSPHFAPSQTYTIPHIIQLTLPIFFFFTPCFFSLCHHVMLSKHHVMLSMHGRDHKSHQILHRQTVNIYRFVVVHACKPHLHSLFAPSMG